MWPFNRLFGRARAPQLVAEQTSTLLNPAGWLLDTLGGGAAAKTGLRVGYGAAMQQATVLACVRVLAESIAALPLEVVVAGAGDVPVRARTHPLWRLLHRAPNRWQTSFEFRELLMGHVCLRGNAYALILRDGRGQAVELLPMHPDRVRIRATPDFDLFYDWTRPTTNQQVTAPMEDVLHVRGISDDGVVGLSVLGAVREAIGLALAAEEFGARLFANGAAPPYALRHPGRISVEAAQRLRAQWQATQGGLGNVGKTALLEEGMAVERLGLTSEDAQYIELRGFQVEEIARAFRVPLTMIGHGDKAPTYASVTAFNQAFVDHSLRPWMERWEQALARDLFAADPMDAWARLNEAQLLRGDIPGRWAYLQTAVAMGAMSVNEARAEMGLPPVADGEQLLRPLNMAPLGTPAPAAAGSDAVLG